MHHFELKKFYEKQKTVSNIDVQIHQCKNKYELEKISKYKLIQDASEQTSKSMFEEIGKQFGEIKDTKGSKEWEFIVIKKHLIDLFSTIPSGYQYLKIDQKLLDLYKKFGFFNIEKLVDNKVLELEDKIQFVNCRKYTDPLTKQKVL